MRDGGKRDPESCVRPVLAADMGSCLSSPNSAAQAQQKHAHVLLVVESAGGEDALPGILCKPSSVPWFLSA
ncbi:hypothetical protein J3F84DRAFT_383605 [Trichoderma pleuroticola]